MNKKKTAISPTRAENYPEWYQEVIKAAELAEHAPVRGCMVITPWGFSIWENIQRILDVKFKERGVQNAYFPLFIPLSFLEKEAQHVEGFAKECAVVTHHRLAKGEGGSLVPVGELEEPLIVRPTSEMMIGDSFAKWIKSYRDLPLQINQWCNVVRWELRTRLFLRTSEFLWQEGHTAHASGEEARFVAMEMLSLYTDFIQNQLAIPVVQGDKTESEKFPGAVTTFTMEAMMQDQKALQMGTSHFLGQNFAKSCGIQFQTEEESRDFAWTTSWGVTTRLIGALIMTHSDDDGLVLPPRIASAHVVILPIIHNEADRKEILSKSEALAALLRQVRFHDEKLRVRIDARDLRGGEKAWGWIKKGVPLRLEVGKREIESGMFSLAIRDLDHRDKKQISEDALATEVPVLLDAMQKRLFEAATHFQKEHTRFIESQEEFVEFFTKGPGGFALCHWNRDPKIEARIKEEYGVTIRCIPHSLPDEEGTCLFTGGKSPKRVLFAKSY